MSTPSAEPAWHRAYVGQPARYDLAAASQFALLFLLGLREHHRVLDFGCGSLRLGRLLIPYLQPDRYFGIEPQMHLVEAGFEHELGQDIRRLKRPVFDANADWRVDGFGQAFDVIVAQSVFSHTGERPLARALRAFAGSLAPGGWIVANWLLGPPDDHFPAETTDWAYPECVPLMPDHIARLAAEVGLTARPCPWPHPELSWFMLARDPAVLPSRERLNALRVAPPAWS